MKKTILFFALLLAASSCKEAKKEVISINEDTITETDTLKKKESQLDTTSVAQSKTFCGMFNFKFSNPSARADKLVSLYKTLQTNPSNRAELESEFFCAFPNSFKQMQALFGFTDGKAAPLYNMPKGTKSYHNEHITNAIIGYFSQMTSIREYVYFIKYASICINATWEADNISEGFGLWNRILESPEQACLALKTFSVDELKSVFCFFFDGPHPKNDYNETIYTKLLPQFEKNDPHLAKLLTDTYTQVINSNTAIQDPIIIELDYPYNQLDGWLQLGLSENQIIKKIGKPESKGEEENWEGVGLFVQEWNYVSKEIILHMASEKAGQPKEVQLIRIKGSNTMKTKENIGIGATRQHVLKTYEGQITPNYTDDSKESLRSIVVGSVYGGVIFSLKNDIVIEIFIGAAAE